jgi:hypothetical protein
MIKGISEADTTDEDDQGEGRGEDAKRRCKGNFTDG